MPGSVEVESIPRSALWPTSPPTAAPATGRLVRGLVLGVLAAGAVLIGRTSGLLDGAAGVLVTVVLVLLVPTSRDMNRRILLAGCLLLGWTQVLFWWPLPVGSLGRVTLGLCVLAGALAAWVGVGAHPSLRARRLVPKPRPVDAVVPLTATLGLLLLRPWLQTKTPTQTLGLLMGGWDNVAHFSMVHMIRRFGVTVDMLAPSAPGATWQFAGYPQGFHAAAAAVVELLIGPADVELGSELLAYTRAMALLVIVATAMLVAGFCALPALRRRPALVAPVAAFVAAVIFLGPGSLAVNGGIGNFAVACCLVVAVVLLAAPMARVVEPLTLAAIGGAIVGIAASWVLMLVPAVAALLMLVLPLRRSRWSASAPRAVAAIVLALIVLGCLIRTAAVLSRIPASSPLTIDGGRVPVDIGVLVAVALAIVGACVAVLRDRPLRGHRLRVGVVMAVPVVAAAAAGALVAIQIKANGEVTYYGYKFLLGMEIVLLPVLAVPVLQLLDRYSPYVVPRRRSTFSGAASSVLVAAALTQVFGLTVSGFEGIGLGAEAQGARNSAHQAQVISQPPPAADLAERVGRMDWRIPPEGAFFVDAADRRVSPVLTAQWFLAFTDTWTLDANKVAAATVIKAPADGPAVAEHILESHPGAVVVVLREEVETLRRAIGRPDLASRIVGL